MTILERNDQNILEPEGEITIFEAMEFRDAFVELGGKSGVLELSLAKVERMDSSAVQLLVAACQEMALRVTNVAPEIQQQFDVIGCGKFLQEPTSVK